MLKQLVYLKSGINFNDSDNWPYIVQLSWVVYNVIDRKIESINDSVIKLPDNIVIPEDSIKIHGITNEIMKRHGKNLTEQLGLFMNQCNSCDLLVAHNIEFDESIISVESIRNYGKNMMALINTPRYCTMKKGVKSYKKWLKLEILHQNLFKQKLKNLHNSLNDVYVCLRCFLKLYFNKDILTNMKFTNFKNKNIQQYHTSYNMLLRP